MLVGVAGEVWLSAWLKYICLMRTLKASNEVHTTRDKYYRNHHIFLYGSSDSGGSLVNQQSLQVVVRSSTLYMNYTSTHHF